MSTPTTLAAPEGAAGGETPAGSARTRAAVIVVVLAVGALASLALGLWHPDPNSNDEFSYAIVEPIRDSWWAWHVFGGIATAALAFAVGLAVCLLVPRRGAAWATAGAVLVGLGGLAFGAGIAAEGVLFAYATDPDALSPETGQALMDHLNDEPARFVVVILPGLALLTLGALLLAAALWRAGTVPRWLPITFGVANVAGFAAPFGPVADAVNLVFTAALLAIGWFLWQQASTSMSTPTPGEPAAPALAGGATST